MPQKIKKIYPVGKVVPLYVGNGICSCDKHKVEKFIKPQSSLVDDIINDLKHKATLF